MSNGFCGVALCLLLYSSAYAQSGTVTYVYTDPQGTPLAEADASGHITATFDYRPYGAVATGTAPNGPGYTGHVNDPDTGLVYMQARFYDPVVGRFISTDPVEPAPGKIYSFNRFAYVNDNPIRFVDPDGRVVQINGSDEDKAKFINQAYQSTGIKFHDVKGKLVQDGKRDTSVGSSIAASVLAKAIGISQTVKIDLVHNDSSVLIDRSDNMKVDVSDLGALFSRNSNLGAASFTHILAERTILATDKKATFDSAHEQALKIESPIMGAAYRTNSQMNIYPGGQFTIEYQDAKQNEVSNFLFKLDQNQTPVP